MTYVEKTRALVTLELMCSQLIVEGVAGKPSRRRTTLLAEELRAAKVRCESLIQRLDDSTSDQFLRGKAVSFIDVVQLLLDDLEAESRHPSKPSRGWSEWDARFAPAVQP